ncbi:NAD(P)-binding protein [Lentinus tigrinus ALCF2SS1-7]|uniref:NAD(P)-binding protein n=1 Tax=Lentinus tigrinus ALCF2SS1-6 TaxID=1328759 RepID=A0A5C2RPG5_9APHY|nr:NAD(P)-binding protein [Lentinus tigrinus ALCF2SS1-6]RPD67920.1 NAD(P)-binding protein [Lentinus tigrinus ALCF2SS1-7]
MPAVPIGKILVTGANGYVSVWIVKTFLEHGFAVRGAVRSERKATYLGSLFQSYGDKFDVVVVEDITKDGAFDEAVKDVDGIVHTASPVGIIQGDAAELILPAVQGTVSILTSALKRGTSVQRIVWVGSAGSVFEEQPDSNLKAFTEADWNEPAIREVETKGATASGFAKYSASKTLAERAAWNFWNKYRAEVAWDLVVLNPTYVFGPILHDVDRPENLNASMRIFYDAAVADARDKETLATWGSSWVDVRDVGLAHVLAMQTPGAGGERIIISNDVYKLQDFVDIAHRLYPQLPAGSIDYDPTVATHYQVFDTSKQRKLFKINFCPMETMVKDTLEDFKARGWI